MEQFYATALSCLFLLTAMFLASFNLKDMAGAKPARLAFRCFYLGNIVTLVCLFFAMTVDKQATGWQTILPRLFDFLTDLSVALVYTTLVIGISWRSNVNLSKYALIVLAVVYLLADGFVGDKSVMVANIYGAIMMIIAIICLAMRGECLNVGDKGLLVVLAINLLFLVVKVTESAMLNLSESEYANFITQVFIYTPAYIATLTVFLYSSYLVDLNRKLLKDATTDSMTGLYNRRYFMAQSKAVLSTAKRHDFPMSVIMCDIDRFKAINDHYGHDVGDKLIKAFSELLLELTRQGDILARFGGEEFVILLPQTDLVQAQVVAERMRQYTQQIEVQAGDDTVTMTASFGLASFENDEIEQNIINADHAMYQAKRSGRNKVVVYKPEYNMLEK